MNLPIVVKIVKRIPRVDKIIHGNNFLTFFIIKKIEMLSMEEMIKNPTTCLIAFGTRVNGFEIYSNE